MAEVLSQSQIDALLSGITAGNVEVENAGAGGKPAKDYDFRSPKKFTKEHLKVISGLHENIGRFLATYLSGIFRYFSEINVVSIEEQRYHEFNNALAEHVLIGMFDLKPKDPALEGMSILFDASTSVGYFLIDRLLGGTGENSAMDRDFTDMEVAILRVLLEKIKGYISDAWNNYLDLDVQVISTETNSRLMQTFLPDDTVVIVVYEVMIKEFRSNMTICIPALQLEQLMVKFNTNNVNTNRKKNMEDQSARQSFVLETISKSKLEVTAVLDEIELGVHDVLGLKVNDIIPLSRTIHEEIDVLVEGKHWLKANMGQTKVRKAVRVCKISDEKR